MDYEDIHALVAEAKGWLVRIHMADGVTAEMTSRAQCALFELDMLVDAMTREPGYEEWEAAIHDQTSDLRQARGE